MLRRLKTLVWRLVRQVQGSLAEEVLVLGDSHARVFGSARVRARFPHVYLNVVTVSGATASGLANPNSKTQAYGTFERALGRTRARTVVVMLGEVDTGFVIWYRAAKYGVPVEAAFATTLETYEGFIRSVRARGFATVCVSAPLPTITDGTAWGDVANERRAVTATQRERTALTVAFNAEVARFCRAEGVTHINLDARSLGPDGLVRGDLLNRNRADHHYARRNYARLVTRHVVRPLLRPGNPKTRPAPRHRAEQPSP